MQFSRETQTLLIVLISAFMLIAIITTYWAITGANTILLRDDNARLFEDEASIIRGNIFDRHGHLLTESIINENGFVSRTYHYPATFGITGYYSLQYGVGGAESAYDTILRGDDLEDGLTTYFQHDILHIPQQGSDVQLTLDIAVQNYLYDALDGHTGAALLLSIPDGQIIAMVTQPSYDPNILDSNWDNLIEDPQDPFFNRALQAQYQPGALFQIPLITLARPNNFLLSTPFANATQPVILDNLTLECQTSPEDSITTLTLENAFIYGCPAPFLRIANQIGEQRINTLLSNFTFNDEPPILDYVTTPQTPEQVTDERVTIQQSNYGWAGNILGQGSSTLRLLDATRITSAIINNGNAVTPYALLATRPPEATIWETILTPQTSYPIMSSDSAQELQQLMIAATRDGGVQAAAHEGHMIGGKVATAFAGERILNWFVGFIITDNQEGFAIAILLENEDSISNIAEIGGNALVMAATDE